MNFDIIYNLFNSKTVRQTFLFFIAQIFGMFVGFVSNMFLAKKIGSHQFGIYSFSLSIITFLSIFFEFGYFASISRLLAENRDVKKEKELFGAAIFIFSLIALLFVVIVFLISFVVDNIFKDKVGYILRTTSIISWAFILPFFMELIMKGSNRIEYLSGFNIIWKVLFLCSLFLLYVFKNLTPIYLLVFFSLSCFFSSLFFILKLKPNFKNLKKNISDIQIETNSYGKHIYIGRIISVASYDLNKLLIGYFVGAKNVGFYNLANTISHPIYTFSFALASSKFKDFAISKKIDKKTLKINLLWITFSIVLINFLGNFVVHYYLGSEYKIVSLLVFLMSLAIGFQAAYQPYNTWLGSKGYGKELKSVNIVMSVLSVIINFVLIYLYKTIGACVASIIIMFLTFYLYKKLYSKLTF